MNAEPLRVLIVEDEAAEASSLELELQRAGYQPVCHRIDSPEALNAAFARQQWDLVLSDYSLARFTALEALALMKAHGQDLPFIIVSWPITDQMAVAAMKAGAQDCVRKVNLAQLGPAVKRGLEEAHAREQYRQAEQALEDAHVQLENRVEQRITELRVTNDTLKKAILRHDAEAGQPKDPP